MKLTAKANNFRLTREQYLEATHNIVIYKKLYLEAVVTVLQYEEQLKAEHYSYLPETVEGLELSAPCKRIILRTVKEYAPGLQTDKLQEMLPFITLANLIALVGWGPKKVGEITSAFAKYGVEIK